MEDLPIIETIPEFPILHFSADSVHFTCVLNALYISINTDAHSFRLLFNEASLQLSGVLTSKVKFNSCQVIQRRSLNSLSFMLMQAPCFLFNYYKHMLLSTLCSSSNACTVLRTSSLSHAQPQ